MQERNPKIDQFLNEIEAVCRKHGLSISHEDSHGSFVIESFDPGNIEWLKGAGDSVTSTKRNLEKAAQSLDAAETQLRIVAGILRKLTEHTGSQAWMDVIDSCERQADYAGRARYELSK